MWLSPVVLAWGWCDTAPTFCCGFAQLELTHDAAQSPWGWEQRFGSLNAALLIPDTSAPAGKILSFEGKVEVFLLYQGNFTLPIEMLVQEDLSSKAALGQR